MRALVTGGTGFIGSHLVETLLATGHEVVCVTRPGPTRGWAIDQRAEVVDCGFHDHARLTQALAGVSVVFHLAGRTHGFAPELYASNTVTTARLMRAAGALGASAPHVVFASSIAAVGPCRDGTPLNAATRPGPISRYGRAKLAAERQMGHYAARVPITILRLPSVYGPREKALLRLIRWIARGFAVTVGSWKREVSLIHVRDAVQGMNAAARAAPVTARSSRLYYMAHSEPVSWERFAVTAADVLGRPRPPVQLSLPRGPALALAWCTDRIAAWQGHASRLSRDRINEISQERWVCDPSDAIRDLTFAPRVGLEAGLRETVAWYRDVGWL